MRPERAQEPEISAVVVLGYLATVLGHAEAHYRRGAAAAAAIGDALAKHTAPEPVAEICRAVWAVMVEPRDGSANDGGPSSIAAANASPYSVERRDVEPGDLVERLRSVLGVMPEHTAAGERAATMGRVLPRVVAGLDVAAWIGWALAGLSIFAGPHPTLAVLRVEVRRYGVLLAMVRGGNLAAASRLTGAGRGQLRALLRGLGAYPWPRPHRLPPTRKARRLR